MRRARYWSGNAATDAASIPMEPSAEMSWFDLSLREQLLAGSAMALTFAVFFVAGLQLGGHW